MPRLRSSNTSTKDSACTLQGRWNILRAATKTRHSQINEYVLKSLMHTRGPSLPLQWNFYSAFGVYHLLHVYYLCDLGACVCVLSRFGRVQLCTTLWTVAHQALLSMGFSRQESWSGLPCPSPGDPPNSRIEPVSPALQADSLPLSH